MYLVECVLFHFEMPDGIHVPSCQRAFACLGIAVSSLSLPFLLLIRRVLLFVRFVAASAPSLALCVAIFAPDLSQFPAFVDSTLALGQ